jgi:plastocyanin
MINTSSSCIANHLARWSLLTLAAGVLLIAAARFASATPATLRIDISKFAFAPMEVTVVPGTTIIWTNKDETPHTVTGQDRTFTSKAMDTGDTYKYTFSQEGDFTYYCTVHPFMSGVVHVRIQ